MTCKVHIVISGPISCAGSINIITSDKIDKVLSISEIARIVKKENKFWVVFTGDSITSCEWVHPNWREIVEYVLKEETTKQLKGDWKNSEWGIRGFNFAYDGATTLKPGGFPVAVPENELFFIF